MQTTYTSRNNAGVKCYGCLDVTIRNNTFVNHVAGIFLKGKTGTMGNTGSIYKNRFIGLTGEWMDIAETQGSGAMDIYQNLAYDFYGSNAGGFHWDNEAGSDLLENVTVRNNTTVMSVTPGSSFGLLDIDGGSIDGTGCTQRDNIFAHTTGYAGNFVDAGDSGAAQAATMGFNYDWIYNNGVTVNYAYNGVGSLSLASFRTNSGWYVNTTVGNPNFVNAATDDYRLSGGSACLTASSTGGPIGCYITGSEEIGLRAAPTY